MDGAPYRKAEDHQQLSGLRQGRSLRAAIELWETGIALMRQNLRRQHPGASDERIGELLRSWLRERPGARFGDCSGRQADARRFLP